MSSLSNVAVPTADSAAPSVRRGRILRGVQTQNATLNVLEPRFALGAGGLDRESERGYAEGFDRGYQDGLTEGRTAMAAEVDTARSRLGSAARALLGAAGELSRRQAIELTQLEDVVAGLAYEIAAAVVGRELATSTSLGTDALARALALAPPSVPALARFHPDDVAVMEIAVPLDRPVTVVPDPAVEPGGCIVEAGDCRIDAQISTALDRVRLALLGDGPAATL